MNRTPNQLIFGEDEFMPFGPEDDLEVCVGTSVSFYEAVGIVFDRERGVLFQGEVIAEWIDTVTEAKKNKVVTGFGIIDQCFVKLCSMVTRIDH